MAGPNIAAATPAGTGRPGRLRHPVASRGGWRPSPAFAGWTTIAKPNDLLQERCEAARTGLHAGAAIVESEELRAKSQNVSGFWLSTLGSRLSALGSRLLPPYAHSMTYDEALAFWFGRINYEVRVPKPGDLKLDRMRGLLELLGNPHQRLRLVHVAGSKGKGSTSAMLATILQRAVSNRFVYVATSESG